MSVFVKSINVRELALLAHEPLLEEINTAFERGVIKYHPIDCVNWSNYPEQPFVEFAIAYSGSDIYIKYNIRESSIRAFYTEDRESKPFEDSCVEFFISMDGSRHNYYNIESNCIGAILFKGGTMDCRVRYDADISKQIKRYSTLPPVAIESQEGESEWSIVLVVPVSLLGTDADFKLSGHRAYANFYKCGDKLPTPHYLSWNPIIFETPSFHQPKYFGELIFE